MENRTLFEADGVWYFQGKTLTIGGPIVIDGVPWWVLGIGRSIRTDRAPFIWIRNDYYGTTVYVPNAHAGLPVERPAPLPFKRSISVGYGLSPKRKIAAAA